MSKYMCAAKKKAALDAKVKRTFKAFIAGDMTTVRANVSDGIVVIQPNNFNNDFTFEPDTTNPSEYKVIK